MRGKGRRLFSKSKRGGALILGDAGAGSRDGAMFLIDAVFSSESLPDRKRWIP